MRCPIAVCLLWLPGVAHAGALVAAQTSTTPARVERITAHYEVRSGTVTTTLEVIVSGDGPLAWVLPVRADTATVNVAIDILDALQAATDPALVLPPEAPCGAAPTNSGGGCACGEPAPLPQGPAPPGTRSPAPPRLGPKPPLVSWSSTRLTDTSPAELRAWLADRGYRDRPELDHLREPWLRGYHLLVIETELRGRRRLLVQLDPFELQLPLELVGDAGAVPLAVLVLVTGAQTHVPLSGVPVTAKASGLFVDRHGVSNYFAWIARSATESEGRWWANERLGPNPLSEGMVSRFFTLLAPHHLRRAVFGPHPSQNQRVDGTIDLSARRSLYSCDQLLTEQEPGGCGFVYCGAEATCTIFEANPACWCSNDQVAHHGVLPDGQTYATCLPAQPSPEPTCAGVDCGAGQCVSDRGRTACVCASERAARVEATGVRCVAAPTTGPQFGPGGGVEALPQPWAGLGLAPFLVLGWWGWRVQRNKSARARV